MPCPSEHTIAEHVHGLLSCEAARAVETHTADCESCRQLLIELTYLSGSGDRRAATTSEAPPGVPARAEPAAPPPGLTLGRYVVEGRLGAGGMGVVLAARDPELVRPVAIKLLHPVAHGADARRERLLREAQLMAQLAHPNVCAVYDVGTFAGQVFLVMERVAGRTLRRWLVDAPRTWRRVRDAYVAAAEGLAAAHAIGIVHCDFKPDNVLMGRDGRPRVTDFGLARTIDEPDPDRVAGTPAYMAPEQRARRPATARSDQYALCVALDEALAGRRPPGWLRRAAMRGRAEDPDARFPSMPALIAALTADRRRRGSRLVVGAGAVAVLAVAGLAAAMVRAPAGDVAGEASCGDTAAELIGAWDPAIRQRVHLAFLGTGAPFAEDAFRSVADYLDRWAAAWTEMRRDACTANRRGLQSSTLMDLRLLCLNQRRAEVKSLIDVFGHADAAQLQSAVPSAYGLTPLAGCTEVAGLVNRPAPPTDPTLRARQLAVISDVARTVTLEHAARYPEARRLATATVAAARELGPSPALSEALVEAGVLDDKLGHPADAEPALREAARVAEAVRADDVVVRARLELLWVVCHSQGRRDALAELRADAEAAIARAGGDQRATAGLLSRVGGVLFEAGRYAEARVALEGAAERLAQRADDALDLASTLNTLGNVYAVLGRAAEGRATLLRAREIRQRLLGAGHPQFAVVLINLGYIEMASGQSHAALDLYLQALQIMETALGGDHPDVGTLRGNLATTLTLLGRHAEAIHQAERALAIRSRSGRTSALALAYEQLSHAYHGAGRLDDCERALRQSLAIREEVDGANHPLVARISSNLGDLLLTRHRPREAAEAHARALRIMEAAVGPASPALATYLIRVGRDEAAAQHPVRSLALLERARALQETADGKLATGIDPVNVAERQFATARALVLRGGPGDRTRGLALANQALAAFRAAGTVAREEIDETTAWLAEHR